MDYRIEFNTIKHTQQPGLLVIMLDGAAWFCQQGRMISPIGSYDSADRVV